MLNRTFIAAVCLILPSLATGQTTQPADALLAAKVLDASGQPVAGVRVGLVAYTHGRGEPIDAVSDAQGTFTARARAGSRVVLRTVAPLNGMFASAVEGDVGTFAPGGGMSLTSGRPGNLAITIRMARPSARIQGQVIDDDGKPVTGALVILGSDPFQASGVMNLTFAALSGAEPAANPMAAATDEQGRYSVAVPPGHHRITSVLPPEGALLTRKPAFNMNPRPVFEGQTLTLNAEMMQAGAVEVTVLDAEGKPVPGATVRLSDARMPLRPLTDAARVSARTDAQGVWRAWGLLPGSALPAATPPADSTLAPGSARPVSIENGKLAKARITLAPGATLSGRITDDAGQPLEGVKINNKAATDKDGRYTLAGLSAGLTTLTLDMRGHPLVQRPTTQQAQVELAGGAPFQRDLVLHRFKPSAVAGTVSGPDGKPVADARVVVYTGQPNLAELDRQASATTDAQGRYRIGNLPAGTLRLSVFAPPDAPLTPARRGMFLGEPVQVPDGQEARFDAVLHPAHLIVARLVDEKSAPVAGALLSWRVPRPADKGGGASSFLQTAGPSDSDGIIRIHVPLEREGGDTITLRRHMGPWVMDEVRIDLGPKARVIEKSITLRTAPGITGSIVDDQGQPVGGAMINIFALRHAQPGTFEPPGPHRAWTDAAGRFAISGLADGKYRLIARLAQEDDRNLCNAAPVEVEVAAGKSPEQKFTLLQGGVIEGEVVGPDGQPIAAAVIARPAGMQFGAGASGVSQPQNKKLYRLTGLAPGSYSLTASVAYRSDREKHGNARAEASGVTVEAGKTVRQDLKLAR